MEKVKFSVSERCDKVVLVEFELSEPLTPSDLTCLTPPAPPPGKAVVLSGRGPVWLYAYLVHHYHPAVAVATYDPRLNGAVVVESHSPDWRVGDVIQV